MTDLVARLRAWPARLNSEETVSIKPMMDQAAGYIEELVAQITANGKAAALLSERVSELEAESAKLRALVASKGDASVGVAMAIRFVGNQSITKRGQQIFNRLLKAEAALEEARNTLGGGDE